MDTLQKQPNELPNTDETERVAAALIVDYVRRSRDLGAEVLTVVSTKLKPVWAVDFYRGRPEETPCL